MTDNATELLPCPFCGGEAEVERYTLKPYAACTKCGCSMPDRHQTAEQAIEVWNTRTHGTLTAEQVREAIEANSWAETSTIREFNDSSWQAIADDLNSMLWSGTCNPVETETLENVTAHVMECDECGGTYEHVNGDYERCPRCGRMVER